MFCGVRWAAFNSDESSTRGGVHDIHFGEYIRKDMIAVRVFTDHRAAIVASPAYFKSPPSPKAPRDLLGLPWH
jgi:hypothetical protein